MHGRASTAESFANALPHLLWIARLDGSVEFVNHAWSLFTGKRPEELLEWRWLEILPPEDRQPTVDYWAHVREGGKAARVQLRIAHASGGYRTVRGQDVPVCDDTGAILYWVGWCVDVEELRAADDPLRSLGDTLPALIFAAGADDRLTYANQAWKDYTGLGIGTTLEERNAIVHRDDLERLSRAVHSKALEIELRIRRLSDGEYRWHLLRWRRFAAPHGAPLYRVGALVDVHDRHIAAAERERAAAEQHFLSEVSRTINNTLDLETVVKNVESLAVPMLGDTCAVDLRRRGVTELRTIAQAKETLPSIVAPLSTRGRSHGAIVFERGSPERPYTERDRELIGEFVRRAALAIDNAQLFGREHRIADAMQSASLPRTLPNVPSLDIHAVYVPGRSEAQIGGDWYDAFRLRDGRIVVSVGDVAGSGIEAAVTMSNMRQIIRGTAQVHADPVLMLNAADRALRLEEESYVTAFVAVVDPIARTVVYANAGHPPPYLCSGTSLQRLEFEDLPLGLRRKSVKRPKAVDLPEDSLLVFYTDGLIESKRDVVEGIAHLEKVLATKAFRAATDPAQMLCNTILSDGARDDVAILTLRVRKHHRGHAGEASRHLYRWPVEGLDADVSHDLRQRLRRVLEEHHYDRATVERGELVLGELIGNVVRHAPGRLEVVLDVSDASPVLHVIDRGPGFERAPMLPADLMSESGRGLYIISELTAEFNVSRSPGGGSHARAVLDA